MYFFWVFDLHQRVCKDNMDKEYADCSIPQEKSNADINAELDISDASCEEDACDVRLDSIDSVQKQLKGVDYCILFIMASFLTCPPVHN